MLASIPANEMAETLRVIAGVNAGNAARHFTRRSHDLGDVAGAVLWTSIAEIVDHTLFSASAPAEELAEPPVPQRMKQLLQATAFHGVWFEDVDPDVLIRERLHETLAAEIAPFAGEVHRMPERPQPDLPQSETLADGDQHEAWRLPLAA